MPLIYQVEPWVTFKVEAAALWPLHWNEIGQDRERLALDPDIGTADAIDAKGMLHVVTARADGVLAGYHVSVIERLVHYKGVLAAKADMYWLHPLHRGPRAAIRLFEAVERSCKARGVQILYDATKLKADQGPMFEHLGYQAFEVRYSKWIG